MIKKIFRTGVTPELSNQLRVKIILSNQVALIMAILELVYATVAWFHFPVILPIYIFGFFITMLVFLLNSFHSFYISRFLVAVFPTIASGATYLAVSNGNQHIVLEIMLVTFSMMISPFMMFESNEKGLRNLCFIICCIPVVFNRSLNNWIDIAIDTSVLDDSYFVYFNALISVGVLFAFMAVMQNTRQRSDDKNKELLVAMKNTQIEMELKSIELEKTIQEVELARIEEERRTWIANGIAQFALFLRQENDIQLLYDRLIAETVKYVKANQGSLFVTHGNKKEEMRLELASCYAYERKRFTEKIIYPGQGLVGQCFLEKQEIIISQIPNDYLQITSGLGHANPSCIVIIPFLFNEEVEAVIEIASFQIFQKYEIEFLEKLGENVAAALKNIKTNVQTKHLLEISQQQAEQMRSAEEEMRQNMEELMATQEEMRRLEDEQKKEIEELKFKLEENNSV